MCDLGAIAVSIKAAAELSSLIHMGKENLLHHVKKGRKVLDASIERLLLSHWRQHNDHEQLFMREATPIFT